VFERAYKVLHNCDYPDDTADSAGLVVQEPVHHNEQVVYLVGIFDHKPDTIVHEVAHTALFILKRANIDPLADSGETCAYMMEYLFNEFGAKIYNHPKKSKVSEVEYMEGREW